MCVYIYIYVYIYELYIYYMFKYVLCYISHSSWVEHNSAIVGLYR